MLASPLGLEPCCLDLDPGVFLNVVQEDVVEDCRRLPASNHTEVVLVNYSGCVSGARFWRLLSGYRGQEPDARSDIKDEDIVEELARVATAEHVEAPFGSALREVEEGVACPGRGYRHGALIVVLHQVPRLLFKVEVVHVIEEV